jgi:hypothetical protein
VITARRAGAVLVTALAAAVGASTPVFAHAGNPHFLTVVDRISPATRGVAIDVINRDDRLHLRNTSGKDVVIEGYDHEPYARVLADGTVQVNRQSPAYYLNDDRYADVTVPKGVTGKELPEWQEVDKTGRFEWHDHRMHWMAKSRPPQVKDPNVRTRVFDWAIPLTIGGTRGRVAGQLFWTPLPGGQAPLGAIFGLVAIVAVLCIAVLVIRRRRAQAGSPAARSRQEAW